MKTYEERLNEVKFLNTKQLETISNAFTEEIIMNDAHYYIEENSSSCTFNLEFDECYYGENFVTYLEENCFKFREEAPEGKLWLGDFAEEIKESIENYLKDIQNN